MDAPDYSVDAILRDGARLHIRAIRPDDKEGLAAFFNRLSPETRYFRFLGAKACLTDDELAAWDREVDPAQRIRVRPGIAVRQLRGLEDDLTTTDRRS